MSWQENIINGLKQLPAELHAAFIEWLQKEPTPRKQYAKAADYEERRKRLESNLPMGHTLIAESRDGKLCLYQDKDGHLTVADARKFV